MMVGLPLSFKTARQIALDMEQGYERLRFARFGFGSVTSQTLALWLQLKRRVCDRRGHRQVNEDDSMSIYILLKSNSGKIARIAS